MKKGTNIFRNLSTFINENKIQFITRIFILLLTVIILINVLPLPFCKMLGINNYHLGCLLAIGGLFSCFKSINQTGWFILGAVTIIFCLEIIMYLKLSSNLHFLNWLILLPIIIWLLLCIGSSLCNSINNQKSYSQIINHKVDLKKQIEKLEKTISNKDTLINRLNDDLNSYIRDKAKLERNYKLHENKISEQNKIIKLLDKQLYESQLSVLFSIVVANSYHGEKDFGLHSFQGNIDNVFADFIGQTNCTFWLLELKRGKKEISDEKLKDIRQLQFTALKENGNEEYKIIADRCHWLGWGDNQNVADILFASYWDTVFELNTIYIFDLEKFVHNSFSDENPIGVNEIKFKQYLDFLLLISKKDTIDIDNIPIVIFRKDSAGRLSKIKSTLFNFIHEYDLYMQREVANKIEQNMYRGMSMSRYK